MIAPAWEAVSTCSGSPSATIAEGTPSWAEATSPAARGWRAMRAASKCTSTFSAASASGKLDQRGVAEQPAQVEAGAKHDKEERDEEAAGDAEYLVGKPFWPADGGNHQPSAKAGDQQAGAAALRQPSQTRTARSKQGAGPPPSCARLPSWRRTCTRSFPRNRRVAKSAAITQAATIALPATMRPAFPGASTSGTATVAPMSATVTCAITASATGPTKLRS